MVVTRTGTCGADVRNLNQELRSASLESLDDRRRGWSQLLRKQHYQPIISDVLDEELPKYANSTVIDATDRATHMRECALILTSAPAAFTAAVEGNLISQLQADSDFQDEYAVIQQRAHKQPSIYIHLLVDEDGISVSPNQYLIIRDIVLDYLSDSQSSQHAWHIDNITPPAVTKQASAEGHRKYLQTTTRSPKRVAMLHRFCQGVQNRWDLTPTSLRDTPFAYPPGECGYSKNSHVRLTQHRAHRSSNHLMNLVEDICTSLYQSGVFAQHFSMHQFIIYLIFRPSRAAIAEIFCSGLLQVWVENGGGFNAYPAGRSVATARRVSEGEWEEHERWARGRSPVEERMRVQREAAEVWRAALAWEEDGEDDEDVDIDMVDDPEREVDRSDCV